MKFSNQMIFWIIIFTVIILLIGIHLSQFTPLPIFKSASSTKGGYVSSFDINANEVAERLNANMTEHFNDISTSEQQDTGASELYNWGVDKEKTDFSFEISGFDIDWKKPDWDSGHNKPPHGPPPPNKPCDCGVCKECKEPKEKTEREICYDCDITANKDINKYVLKSSIPPCPDMGDYVTKNMMKPEIDMNEYIKKNEIKPCPKVDMSRYVLKSEIPACPPQVICPVCPICPKCEEAPKCKEVNEFVITEHKDMKDYIKISDVINSDIVKKYIADNYIEKSQCKPPPSNPPSPPRNPPPPPRNPQPSNSSNKASNNQKQDNQQTNQQTNQQDKKQQDNQYNMSDVQGMYVGDSVFATV